MARAVGVRLQVGRALEGLGRSALKAGDEAGGVDHLRQALALFQELGVPEAAAVRATLDEVAST